MILDLRFSKLNSHYKQRKTADDGDCESINTLIFGILVGYHRESGSRKVEGVLVDLPTDICTHPTKKKKTLNSQNVWSQTILKNLRFLVRKPKSRLCFDF